MPERMNYSSNDEPDLEEAVEHETLNYDTEVDIDQDGVVETWEAKAMGYGNDYGIDNQYEYEDLMRRLKDDEMSRFNEPPPDEPVGLWETLEQNRIAVERNEL